MRNTAQSSTCTDNTNQCTLREAVGHCNVARHWYDKVKN